MQSGRWLSGPGAVLVLIFFFLPWVTVSCGNQEIATFSGYDLAAGAEINTGFTTEKTEGDAAVFIIPAVALVAGVLLVLSSLNVMPGRVAGGGQVALAIVGVVILWLKWSQMEQDVTAEGGAVAPEIGLWLTAAALAVIVLGGILTLIENPGKNQYPDSYNYSSGPYY